MVLTKGAAEVTHAEKHRARAVVARDAGLFGEMGGDDVDFCCEGACEADARGLVAVDGAEAGAEVAVGEMGVGEGAFGGDLGGGEGVVEGGVAVEEERGGQVEGTGEGRIDETGEEEATHVGWVVRWLVV